METIKEQLDYIYKISKNQNKTLLEERVLDVLSKTLCDIVPIEKTTSNDLVVEIISLNETLNKHPLCTNNLVKKDKYFEHWLQAAITFLEDKELAEQLQIAYEKGHN